MVFMNAELISGCVLGFEHVNGEEIYGEEDSSNYISIDLIFFRVVLEFTND
jgi:hypothetical protein